MKIALFSQPRSRSSLLINSISEYYKIKNYFEYFQSAGNSFLRRENIKNDPWLMYQDYASRAVTKMHNEPHCVKFIPTNFIDIFYKSEKSITDTLLQDQSHHIKNFVDFFRLKDYDKIYITYRENLTEALCSMNNANLNRSWWLREKKDLPFQAVDLTNTDIRNVMLKLIFTKVLLEKIELKLTEHGISFIRLGYNEIPTYVQPQYPEVSPGVVETDLDYQQLTPNFDEIQTWVNDNYNALNESMTQFRFS